MLEEPVARLAGDEREHSQQHSGLTDEDRSSVKHTESEAQSWAPSLHYKRRPPVPRPQFKVGYMQVKVWVWVAI